MSVHQILDDLFFVERGYLNANHFVYRSEQPILIDTGYVADFAETERLISGLGVDLSRTHLIVSTHAHCDHVGGNRIIQDRSGCDVALHRVGKHFIDTGDDWSTWWRYYGQEADFFDCTIGLEDGDVVAVGPHEFRVLYTPGHASDGMVLYNEREKVLLSSDTLWESDLAVITIRVEGSRAPFSVLEGLDKLERLDVKVVYPGHGKPFTDVKAALAKSRNKVANYLRNREAIGTDVLKKILVYTLLMKKGVQAEGFFFHLMETHWFKETVDLYFGGAYQEKYDEVMGGLLRRGAVRRADGRLVATVRP